MTSSHPRKVTWAPDVYDRLPSFESHHLSEWPKDEKKKNSRNEWPKEEGDKGGAGEGGGIDQRHKDFDKNKGKKNGLKEGDRHRKGVAAGEEGECKKKSQKNQHKGGAVKGAAGGDVGRGGAKGCKDKDRKKQGVLVEMVSCPLFLLGAKSRKAINLEFQSPCRTTKCPREIPALCWLWCVLPQVAFAGLLPLNAINIELYYIFVTAWGHSVHFVWHPMYCLHYNYYCPCLHYYDIHPARYLRSSMVMEVSDFKIRFIRLIYSHLESPFSVAVLSISMPAASTITFKGQI
ncbi:hypothetical protein ACH5RR_036394 [Cinchona calisaya]|uniref:Transmembrane 9 superfamily member n=1 Tax=Cinchona calisaya TaxID=153742 RepID=A0ABD2Y6Z5_9GENT